MMGIGKRTNSMAAKAMRRRAFVMARTPALSDPLGPFLGGVTVCW
jgi:hypothetical protein